MNWLIRRLMTGLITAWVLMTSSAVSAESRPDGFYGGLKVAYFMPELTAAERETFDGPDNAGLVLGYEKRYPLGYGGAELGYSTSFLDGTIDNGPISADTIGAYAVYRTIESTRVHTGPYFKFKAGVYHYDAVVGDDKPSLTTGAFGLGFGINMYVVRFELEILVPEKDLQFVSFHILF